MERTAPEQKQSFLHSSTEQAAQLLDINDKPSADLAEHDPKLFRKDNPHLEQYKTNWLTDVYNDRQSNPLKLKHYHAQNQQLNGRHRTFHAERFILYKNGLHTIRSNPYAIGPNVK